MDNAVLIAVIGGAFGVVTAVVTGIFLYKNGKKTAETNVEVEKNKVKIEATKSEALAQVEMAKSKADFEMEKIHLLLDNLQKQNNEQAQREAKADQLIEELRSKEQACQEEKLGFKLELQEIKFELKRTQAYLEATEAQYKANQVFIAAGGRRADDLVKKTNGKSLEVGDKVKLEAPDES